MDDKEKKILVEIMQWAARREHCEKEARIELARRDLSSEIINKYIDILINERYIDNERFSEAFVRDKFRFNKWGKYRLRNELRLRDIPDDIIDEALSGIPEAEYHDCLDGLLELKLARLGKESRISALHKITTFAVRKGFEPTLVRERAEEIIRKHL